MDRIERIIALRPSLHASETEVGGPTTPGTTCYAIGEDVLRYLAREVGGGSRTLETGAGCSTLVLAARGATHTAITPARLEIAAIREVAAREGIDLGRVDLVAAASERYLPRCEATGLDLVLLDGKHAFPWPMLDWFFTAGRLKVGGLMVLDDCQMRSVAVLAAFLAAEPCWEVVADFGGKTRAFRKRGERVLDVAWHMQPWTVAPSP